MLAKSHYAVYVPHTMPDTLTHTQAMRYNRQIVLPQIDLDGQEKICQAKVLIVGMGGLGTAVAQSLCGSGVGKLTLVDDDIVTATNLPRQWLYSNDQCGMQKVIAAKEKLTMINPECDVFTIGERLSEQALQSVAESHHVIVDCTDNLAARQLNNAVSWQTKTPLVSGAAIRFEGQLFVSMPHTGSPCYGCLEQSFTQTELSCTEAGILSPVVSLIGMSQAQLVLQVIIGFGTLPVGKLTVFDGLNFQWHNFTIPSHAHCQVCQAQSNK